MRFLVFLCAALLTLPAFAADKKPATYERVTQSKVLRCGYLPYEPFISKDANTGKLSGLTVEYLNAIAAREGYTIEWASEVNIDQIIPTLAAGRVDAFCMPCTPDKVWDELLGFGAFLGALPYFTYVPKDSTITREQLETAKFAVVDGYALTEITKGTYPKAQYASLPQTTSSAEMYDQLRYGKVDAHVNEGVSGVIYDRNNPGTIRRFSDEPVVSMRMFLVVGKEEAEMKNLLDTLFDVNLPQNTPVLEGLLTKYGLTRDAFLYGERCAKAKVTGKGWKVCDTTEE